MRGIPGDSFGQEWWCCKVGRNSGVTGAWVAGSALTRDPSGQTRPKKAARQMASGRDHGEGGASEGQERVGSTVS